MHERAGLEIQRAEKMTFAAAMVQLLSWGLA
jgi:hypothetical protein